MTLFGVEYHTKQWVDKNSWLYSISLSPLLSFILVWEKKKKDRNDEPICLGTKKKKKSKNEVLTMETLKRLFAYHVAQVCRCAHLSFWKCWLTFFKKKSSRDVQGSFINDKNEEFDWIIVWLVHILEYYPLQSFS